VLKHALNAMWAQYLRHQREARDREDARFASGDDSDLQQQPPARYIAPCFECTHGDAYTAPRKARKGGGTVIDWEEVRRQAGGGSGRGAAGRRGPCSASGGGRARSACATTPRRGRGASMARRAPAPC